MDHPTLCSGRRKKEERALARLRVRKHKSKTVGGSTEEGGRVQWWLPELCSTDLLRASEQSFSTDHSRRAPTAAQRKTSHRKTHWRRNRYLTRPQDRRRNKEDEKKRVIRQIQRADPLKGSKDVTSQKQLRQIILCDKQHLLKGLCGDTCKVEALSRYIGRNSFLWCNLCTACPVCPHFNLSMAGCTCRCRQGLLKLIQSLQRLVSGTLTKDKLDDELEMTTVCHRPEGLDQLEAQTNFTKQELQILYRGFKNECPSGVVDEETFKHIYAQFFPHGDASMYAHYLFNAFDTTNNGSIKFKDFVMGLSILLRGTLREKLEWTFHLYDINRDGYINREEMTEIVRAIYDMMGKFTYPALKGDVPQQHVDAFFQKMDKNKDGVVTLEEFIIACQEDETMMNSMQLFENVM